MGRCPEGGRGRQGAGHWSARSLTAGRLALACALPDFSLANRDGHRGHDVSDQGWPGDHCQAGESEGTVACALNLPCEARSEVRAEGRTQGFLKDLAAEGEVCCAGYWKINPSAFRGPEEPGSQQTFAPRFS